MLQMNSIESNTKYIEEEVKLEIKRKGNIKRKRYVKSVHEKVK